jgi:ABC-type uncharacterized transport system permease subunit
MTPKRDKTSNASLPARSDHQRCITCLDHSYLRSLQIQIPILSLPSHSQLQRAKLSRPPASGSTTVDLQRTFSRKREKRKLGVLGCHHHNPIMITKQTSTLPSSSNPKVLQPKKKLNHTPAQSSPSVKEVSWRKTGCFLSFQRT